MPKPDIFIEPQNCGADNKFVRQSYHVAIILQRNQGTQMTKITKIS